MDDLDELMEMLGLSRPEAETKTHAEGNTPPEPTEKARPKPKQQNERPAEKLPEPIPPKKPGPPVPTEHGSWGGFIERWIKYGESRTDAPVEFHQIGAHVLIATAINRNRWLDLSHKRVYPSIYGLALGPSGKRKSTPLAYAVEACPKGLRLANDYSPEALIADLNRRDQARGTAFIDEAGRLLGTMRKNHYGEGMKDLLGRLWDAPDEEDRILQKEKYHLKSVYLNLVMATTQSRFVEVVSPEDIQTGFLARFLPVLPSEDVEWRPITRLAPEVEEEKKALTARLGALRTYMTQSSRAMEITNAALDALNENEKELLVWAEKEYHCDLLHPWALRLSEYSYRLSINYAVNEVQETVDLPHVQSAILVIERARDNARLVVEDLTATKDVREAEKLFQLIRHFPGISNRDLCRKTNFTSGRINFLVGNFLLPQERIKPLQEGKTIRYYPVSEKG